MSAYTRNRDQPLTLKSSTPKKLNPHVRAGWQDSSLPRRSDLTVKMPPVTRCELCRSYMWVEPTDQDTLKCVMCRRISGLKSKLTQETQDQQNSRGRDGDGEVHDVQVMALRNAIRDRDLNWSETEMELHRHKAALKFLESDEYLSAIPPPDKCSTWKKETHHRACIELLHMHAGGCKAFVVKHLDTPLGRFHGYLPELGKIIYDVDMDMAREDVGKNWSTRHQKSFQKRISSMQGFPEKQTTPAVPSLDKHGPQEVPLVSVCVQGGHCSVRTVKDAVMNATPALLIKGSGQAACLMADAVVIKDYTTSTNQKTMLDEQQQKLLTFVEFMMFVFQIQSGKQGKFNYTKLIECLKESSRKLEIAVRTQLSSNNLASSAKWAKFREVFCFESTRIPMSERYVGEEARVSAPQSAMRVEREGAILVGQTYRMDTSQFSVCELLCNVFQAANTGKCHVFDLHNTEPDAKSFKESLLECSLNGICVPEEETPHTFGKKVLYAIRWECDKILLELLRQQTCAKAGEKEEVLKACLIEAIARNNVTAVNALFEDTHVSVDQFDVGFRLHRKYDILELTAQDKSNTLVSRYFQNAAHWHELVTKIKESWSKHVVAKESDHMLILKEAAKSDARFADTNGDRLSRAGKEKDEARILLENSQLDPSNSSSCEFNFRLKKYEKRLLMLEQIYRNLLGKNFEYHIGSMGPDMDLFFLNVLVRCFVYHALNIGSTGPQATTKDRWSLGLACACFLILT